MILQQLHEAPHGPNGDYSAPVVATKYDRVGNVIEVTDPRGFKTQTGYDAANRPVIVLAAVGTLDVAITLTEYDLNGNVIAVTDPNNNLNRTMVYKGGVGPLEAVLIGDPNHTGDPQNSDPLRSTSWQLDFLDRKVSETSAGKQTWYAMDLVGNLRITAYPGTGTWLYCQYDELNRLEVCDQYPASVGLGSGPRRSTYYKYDLNSNVLWKWTDTVDSGQNATTVLATENTYDSLNRRSLIETLDGSAGMISSFDYTYDLVGNVVQVLESYGREEVFDRTLTNSYDHANRLASETAVEDRPGGNVTTETEFAYDQACNRLSRTVVGPGTETFTYGNITNDKNTNQLVSFTRLSDDKTVSFDYDANGNRSQRYVTGLNDDTYEYEYENRLIGLDYQTDGDAGEQGEYLYTYDFRTRRVGRDESATTAGENTTVVFSHGLSVQEYLPSVSEPEVEYIRGSDYGGGVGGVLFTLRSDGESPAAYTAKFNAYNSRGDVVAKTDEGGTIDWQASYEAFGTRTQQEGVNDDRQKANTKDEDPTGLLNEGMRYRDLEAGVFITRAEMVSVISFEHRRSNRTATLLLRCLGFPQRRDHPATHGICARPINLVSPPDRGRM